MTVTSGISGSSICDFDRRVDFHLGDMGLVDIPSVVDENTEVPKVLWTDGGSTGKHAVMMPRRGTMLVRSDFRAEP